MALGATEKSLPVLVEAIGREPGLSARAAAVLPWLVWQKRWPAFIAMDAKAKEDLRFELLETLSEVPDERAFDPLWRLLAEPRLTSPAAGWCQWEFGGLGGMTQGAEKETVAADGMMSVQRPPQAVRMYLQITGRGKILDEALAQLRQRREKATAALAKLAVDPKSVSFTTPMTGGANESQQRRQMEMMIRQRMQMGGNSRLAKALKLPEVVNVNTLLTAQWPLDAAAPEKVLLRTHELGKAVKAADLAGLNDKGNLTEEEQEASEEMAGAMAQYRTFAADAGMEPGAATFLYVANISDDECSKAMAEAFGKAKAEAGRLAQASGARLGRLVGISGGLVPSAGIFGEFQQSLPSSLRNLLMRKMTSRGRSSGTQEALSADPNETVFLVQVRAAFALDSALDRNASKQGLRRPPSRPPTPHRRSTSSRWRRSGRLPPGGCAALQARSIPPTLASNRTSPPAAARKRTGVCP